MGYSKLFWSKKRQPKLMCAEKKTTLKWTWDQLFRLCPSMKRRKKFRCGMADTRLEGWPFFELYFIFIIIIIIIIPDESRW